MCHMYQYNVICHMYQYSAICITICHMRQGPRHVGINSCWEVVTAVRVTVVTGYRSLEFYLRRAISRHVDFHRREVCRHQEVSR